MGDVAAGHRLVAVGVATSNVVLLVLALTLFLHRSGTLSESLGNLSTESGLGLFIALWWITSWSTRRGLRGMDPLASPAELKRHGWVGIATHQGGIAGSAFAALLGVMFACQLVARGAANVWQALIFALFFIVFASVPSFVFGMVAGFVLGWVDLACGQLSARLFRACTSSTP